MLGISSEKYYRTQKASSDVCNKANKAEAQNRGDSPKSELRNLEQVQWKLLQACSPPCTFPAAYEVK